MSSNGNLHPALFGIKKSNKDFSKKACWGKNHFNNAFPASLTCYLHHEKIKPVYIKIDNNSSIVHDKIDVENIFGIDPLSENLYFGFEKEYSPYAPLVIDSLPRIDLVTFDISGNSAKCLKPIEIKLTALPDNQTCDSEEKDYGSEIVVRPDTIVYLALSIALEYLDKKDVLFSLLDDSCGKNINWEEEKDVLPLVPDIISAIEKLFDISYESQQPFLMQPIWKTLGKTLEFADGCFDIFIWSELAFTKLFLDISKKNSRTSITRHTRTVIWLAQMVYQFSKNGQIDHKQIIDKLSYNTKNDKAFACSGIVTNPYMQCNELLTPRIKKEAIKEIILGGGQKYLSPERRLDAAIRNSEELFNDI